MESMTWTDKPPKRPGWYWCRSEYTINPVIAEVDNAGGVYLPLVEEFLSLKDFSANSTSWAGPIREPEEA